MSPCHVPPKNRLGSIPCWSTTPTRSPVALICRSPPSPLPTTAFQRLATLLTSLCAFCLILWTSPHSSEHRLILRNVALRLLVLSPRPGTSPAAPLPARTFFDAFYVRPCIVSPRPPSKRKWDATRSTSMARRRSSATKPGTSVMSILRTIRAHIPGATKWGTRET